MSEKSAENTGSDNTFAPSLLGHCLLSLATFSGMSSISVHQKLVNLYIFYIADLGQEI